MKRCLAAFCLLTLLSGCATIVSSTKQHVGVSSTPTGADVTVDDQLIGKTPVVANLKRKNIHTIKIEMAGYKPYEIILTKKTNPWILGNIIFGGLIGLAVDAITGAIYKLTPEQVNAQLVKEEITPPTSQNGIYIFVTFAPDGRWEKIGSLAPTSLTQ